MDPFEGFLVKKFEKEGLFLAMFLASFSVNSSCN